MNPKIPKLRSELDKNKEKISGLQARNRELERQIRELEDFDIVGMVRETGMSLDQLAALFRSMKESPLPVADVNDDKEDVENEE